MNESMNPRTNELRTPGASRRQQIKGEEGDETEKESARHAGERGNAGTQRYTKATMNNCKGEKPIAKSRGVRIGLLSVKPALQNGAALKKNLRLPEAATTLWLHEEADANSGPNTNRSPSPP